MGSSMVDIAEQVDANTSELLKHGAAIADLKERSSAAADVSHASEHAAIHEFMNDVRRWREEDTDADRKTQAGFQRILDTSLAASAAAQKVALAASSAKTASAVNESNVIQIAAIAVAAMAYLAAKKLGIGDVEIGVMLSAIGAFAMMLLKRKDPPPPPPPASGGPAPQLNGGAPP